MRRRTQRAIALHEGAHAVVLIHLGSWPSRVTIIPNGEIAGLCQCPKIPLAAGDSLTAEVLRRLAQQVTVNLAGPAMDRRRDPEGDWRCDWHPGSDWNQVWHLMTVMVQNLGLAPAPSRIERYLDRELARASQLVSQNWDAIELIAKELLKRKTLVEADLRELLAPNS